MLTCEITGRKCPTLDEHHVIPREYGGINGPVVKIDPAVHQAIHRYVHNPTKLGAFLSSYPVEVQNRILMLVTAIKEAEDTLNKVEKRSVTITFSEEEFSKLEKIAEYTNKTVPNVVKTLVINMITYS